MPTPLDPMIAELNTATNEAADRIARLVAQVSTGMTQAQVDEVKAAGAAVVERLHVLGQDPAEPVPPPDPVFAKLKT